MGASDIKFAFANGSAFVLKNVRCVLKLTKCLILASQLGDVGYHVIFGFRSWKIQKGSMLLARGANMETLNPPSPRGSEARHPSRSAL